MVSLKVNNREKEFFTYMLRGMRTEEIAEIMGLSPKSASIYRNNILVKNRYKSSFKLICDWYIERDEKLSQKVGELKAEISELKKELRKYKNEAKRRKRKNYYQDDSARNEV